MMFGIIYKWSRDVGEPECEAETREEAAKMLNLEDGDWFFQHMGVGAYKAHKFEYLMKKVICRAEIYGGSYGDLIMEFKANGEHFYLTFADDRIRIPTAALSSIIEYFKLLKHFIPQK